MIGRGMKDITFGFIPLPNIPLPLFSLLNGPSHILHFAAARAKLDASALVKSAGPSSKVIGRGMIGRGMKDMTFGFIPLPNIPLPLFFAPERSFPYSPFRGCPCQIRRVGPGKIRRSVQQVMGRGMKGRGIKDMTFGFIPLPNIPLPLFSLLNGPSHILHFAAARAKLDASALVKSAGPSSKVMGRGMIGRGMKDITFGFIPLPNIPLPLFSLLNGPSHILHFAAVRAKLDASVPVKSVDSLAGRRHPRYLASMRKLALIFSGALALAFLSRFQSVQAADIPPAEGYTRIANPDTNTTQLQIALRKFVPAEKAGPALWLAAVMHVGEPDYYTALQHFLSTQTVVLYEGINAESHPRHVHDSDLPSTNAPKPVPAPSGTNAPYSMQSTLARSLGLVFQLEAIDYDRTNFLNSDLSIQQIQHIMSGGMPLGPPGKEGGGGGGSSFDTLLQIMDGSSFLGSLFKWGMQFIAASPELQAVAKLTLIEAVGRLKGDLSDVQGLPPDWKDLIRVLIEARNKNLVADLKDELKKVPNSGSVAVFYGVGHMDDLEKRITSELHYRPAYETWLTAFSVNFQKGGVSAGEAQMIRALVKSELDQMQAATNSSGKSAP